MTLGFSVETLVPAGRGGGPLRMGLTRVPEAAARDPEFDRNARNAAFDRWPESLQTLPGAQAAQAEVAALLGADSFEAAARSGWEDLCLLEAGPDGVPVLTAAALAFPTDWHLADKIGRPLLAIHAPIHGYADQLSAGVDHFIDGLKPGTIFGRTNWFVVASADLRYLPTDDPATRFAHVTASNAGETLFVRCERQTLRRLPETGAILFTIGIYVEPLGALPAATVAHIANNVATVPEGEAERRAAPHYAEALAEYVSTRLTLSEAAA